MFPSEVFGPVEQIEYYLTAFNLFIVVIGGLIAFLVTRNIVRPLQGLEDILSNISRGETDIEIPDSYLERDDEIGKLSRSFHRVMASLKLAMKDSGNGQQGATEEVNKELD